MKNFLLHFFLPQESNNHRPKILHHKSLLLVIIFLFVGQFFLTFVKINFPAILGTSTNISAEELLLSTNQNRQKAQASPLTLNNQLSEAAELKAKDMFAKDYWAHNSPEGTTPWAFLKKTGYDYIYAGENLARGFSSSQDVVNAWMASQSHKENMLSNSYQDVGFAVVSGKLNGENVVLVVEMFGGKGTPPLAKVGKETGNSKNTLVSQTQSLVASVKVKPLIDINNLSQGLSMFILFLFVSILTLDMIIIERKKIVRLVGHNIDHIFFLIGILILIVVVSRGAIL